MHYFIRHINLYTFYPKPHTLTLALLLLALTILPSPVFAQDITSGLIGHWKFDEGSGTTATDSSGSNNVGTLTNGPTWTTGKVGNALSFDGVDDYVNIPDSPLITTTINPFTVSFWARPSVLAADGFISKQSASFSFDGWTIEYNASGNLIIGTNGNNANHTFTSITTDFAVNLWHHVVVLIQLNGTVQGYVNNVLVISQTDTNTAVSEANPLIIGRGYQDTAGNFFNGLIDEVRIYNRALTAADIQALYNLGSGLPDTTPPSIPTNLTATPISSSQINLSWSASIDNVGVTGYRVERCQGAGCTTFAQVATPSTNSYSDTGLSASTNYTYRVRAVDAAGNLSTYSSIVSATTQAPPSGGGIPSVLGWYAIPNTHLRTVCPETTDPATYTTGLYAGLHGVEGCAAVIDDWSSGAFDDTRNRLLMWGGGHNGYYGNELYALNLNTLTVSRLTDPGAPIATGGPNEETIAGGTQPNSRHTYDGIAYMSHADRFFSFGGSVAGLIGGVSRATWVYRFADGAWQQMYPAGTPPPADEAMVHVAYDRSAQRILAKSQYDLYEYKLETNSWTKLTTVQQYTNYPAIAIIDPDRNEMWVFGWGADVRYDIGPGSTYTPAVNSTSGGSAVINAAYPGLAYDSYQKKIVAWVDGNTVYTLDPVTRVWSSQSYSGGPTKNSTGTYKRFAYSPISNVFTICNSVDVNCYSLRLNSGTPTSDTQAPTTPTSLSATAVSSSQINLSWTASTDNVGVTGYRVERCQGVGCTNFAQVGTPSGASYSDTGLTASTPYSYRIRAADVAGNLSGYSANASAATQALPSGGSDFQTRCSAAGVIRCVGFDQASDIAGGYGDNSGINIGAAAPTLDAVIKASGNSALKMTIPSNSPANTSGAYFTNFSTDLATQFGENSEFYVQWRQRFSPEFLNTYYQGGGGWKQGIIGTGDKPGCNAPTSASGLCYSSCTSLETVTQNTYQKGFAQMYNSCSGSASHGPYDGFNEPLPPYDFKLQNARPAPYCLYSQSSTGYFPPNGNCFSYSSNEWMTFQVHIKTGPRVGDEWVNSHIDLWIARDGQLSEQALNWGPYNLTAGSASEDQKFGKVWLIPYHTGKDPAQSHPVTYTWYDELIISRNKIADPGSSTPPPTTLLGDLNNDRTVNALDWSIMESQWFTALQPSDINKDGVVNSIDFSLLNANWGRTI